MIELKDVTKRYGSVQALRGVSFRADKGCVTGLLGQNGAGKTTLLNILTGYLAPTSGQALLDGADPLMNPMEARRKLGYLPEQPPLYDEMTVREYLRFAAELRGVKPRAVPAHVDEIMEMTGLTDMRDRLLAHLSKGYRQRAGLAQALCGDPEALILDEPTVGLDPKQITEIRGLIRSLGAGRTILFSSHILGEVQQLCDRVVILNEGRVSLDLPLRDAAGEGDVTLLCTMAAAEQSIVRPLTQLEGVRRVTVQPSARPDETTALIAFHDQPEPERRLFTLLSGLGVPILRLTRSQDSLEEVFLRAISDGETK